MSDLLETIDELFDTPAAELGADAFSVFEDFLDQLEAGELRAAVPRGRGEWEVQPSVKRGILLGFRLGENGPLESAGPLHFSDKHTYPTQRPAANERNVRIVPGGSSVRRGAYLGRDVTMMPPAYVNVGGYVDDGTMVDSHALVGSCAQIGKNVHLSAAAQIGGVLEPIGQTPVIIEDDVMVGGNTGIFEGVHVRTGAVIGAGSVLTASTPVFDLVEERVLRATDEKPLTIPENAVVIPGSRPARGEFAEEHGLQMSALLIIKYRDEKTDAATALEDMLR
jgi:2,3,4,5-tetrahydropyridine-2-carboxylate N-succinyltransferase